MRRMENAERAGAEGGRPSRNETIVNDAEARKLLSGRTETLLLALVLVAAFHAIPRWLARFLAGTDWCKEMSEDAFSTFYDALSGVMPLTLCLSAPVRSGLGLGRWQGRIWKVLGVCALPVALTAVIYPFTSMPFKDTPIGTWLISPAAQDLLFTGYLYGVFVAVFPGRLSGKVSLEKAIPMTALFFALWHLPNFAGLPVGYVVFQLIYVFIGGVWVLLARQMTGSLWPGVLTHMAVNYVACRGW